MPMFAKDTPTGGGQLSLRGVVIGCIGCAVITASSVYTALKMGALPWPIIFAAIVSLFFLKLVSRNRSTLNEANVTHTVMSAGAMVAGGLAFTIPGAWMLGLADGIEPLQMYVIAFAGSALGLLGSIMLRRHFIEDAKLEYPIGEAAAQTLKAGDAGGKVGVKLFGSLGFAAVYCLLRDGLKLIPSLLCQLNIPGVVFGIYNSPMSLAVGFLVGTGAMCVWFAGALIANFGIIVGAPAAGLCGTEAAQAVVSSLGMGLMMGCGVAVVVKDILPKGAKSVLSRAKSVMKDAFLMGLTAESAQGRPLQPCRADGASPKALRRAGLVAVFVGCIAATLCIVLGLPVWVSIAVVLCSFVACIMSAQSVGQTGIDPMEIFGLIVLLIVAALAQIGQLKLFFVAALVAVACGLAGDVMNDFKAGHVLGTDPRAQWAGQAIGAVVGSVVAVAVMQVLLAAYGPGAFGPGAEFVSAQASVVATMVGGIPDVGAFLFGLVLGFVLYLAKFPAMMLGLGVYLPFYLSLTAFLGCAVRLIFDLVGKLCRRGLSPEAAENAKAASEESGLIAASGLLGGESVMGIILALILTASALG